MCIQNKQKKRRLHRIAARTLSVMALALAGAACAQEPPDNAARTPEQNAARPLPPRRSDIVQQALDKAEQERAARRWDAALAAYEQAAVTARGLHDSAGEVAALAGAGRVYALLGRLPQALASLQQALPLLNALGDTAGEAVTRNNIGNIWTQAGQPANALDSYEQALRLERRARNKSGESATFTNIGNVYAGMGRADRALEAYQNAVAVSHSAGDRSGEAAARAGMGNAYVGIGQSVAALGAYQQALEAYRALSDRSGEANALTGIGGVYALLGQTARALDCYGQALPAFHAANDAGGEAAALNNIGGVYAETARPERALECYRQALPLERAAGSSAGAAATLNNIGSLCADTGQTTQALDYHRQALALFVALDNKPGAAAALTYMGNVYARMGRPTDALNAYRQALPLARESGDRAGEANTLNNMGAASARLSQPAEAESAFRQAIAQIETLRRDLGQLSDSKVAFTEHNLSAYRGYLDLLIRQKRYGEAFGLAQQMKSRTLLELLATNRADLTARLNDEERTQLAALQARPDALNRQMIALGVRNEIGDKRRFEALQEQLRQAERDLSAYSDTLYVKHPDLAQARAVQPLSARQAAALLPPGTALLEFATRLDAGRHDDQTGLVLFVVTPDGIVTAHDLPVTTAQVQPLAAAFHASCADPRKPCEAQARELYRLLLAPAQSRLAGVTHLLLCPDGPLWNVPFAALQDGAGRFVGERHVVTLAYSATAAGSALARRAQPRAPGSVLCLANPDFGSAARVGDDLHLPGQRPIDAPARPFDAPARPFDAPSRPFDAPSRDLLSQLRAGSLVPLPGTQNEADMLRRLYPDARILTGSRAQEAAFKQAAGQYRYLHLASHAFFNDASPLLSCVFLAAPPAAGPGSEEDGYLSARELLGLHLNAELVTLSACQTGQGEQRAGEGVIGLTWALTVAGVPTQIVSQWSVDDAATAQFMGDLYAGLRAGTGKGDALSAAASRLRQDGAHSHPYYWAPFVVIGDWR